MSWTKAQLSGQFDQDKKLDFSIEWQIEGVTKTNYLHCHLGENLF